MEGFRQDKQNVEEIASQGGEEVGYLAGLASAMGGLFGSNTGQALGGMKGGKGSKVAVAAAAIGLSSYGAYKASESYSAPKALGDYFGRNVDHVLDFFGSDAADQRLKDVDAFRENQAIPDMRISGPSKLEASKSGQGGGKSNIENVDIVVNVLEDKIDAEIKVDGETYQGANQGFPR